MDKLIEDWVEVELGEILKVSSGKGLTSNKMSGNGFPVYGGNGITGFHSDYLFEEQKLIIGRVGVKCGVTHITKPKSWITDNALIIEFKIPEINIYFMQFKLQFEDLNKLSNSTAQPVISGSKIYSYSIFLPPLPIQRAIVLKIENLFAALDKGIADLEKAQQQLKVYRQAVLKKAFEGGFTNKNKKEGELPEGWKWVKLGEVCEPVKKVRRNETLENESFIYLDIGGIDNSINKIVSHKSYMWKDAPSRAQQIVNNGDTLFSTVRTYLKNIAIVDKTIYSNQICSSGFTVIRGKKDVLLSKYVFHYSLCERFLQPLNELQTGTSYPAVRDKDVFSQIIPLPLLTEQHQIVREIESRLSVCDKVEQSITESLEKAKALRQSILKKAFEGKLLSEAEIAQCKQEKDYEPASVLLQKVRTADKKK